MENAKISYNNRPATNVMFRVQAAKQARQERETYPTASHERPWKQYVIAAGVSESERQATLLEIYKLADLRGGVVDYIFNNNIAIFYRNDTFYIKDMNDKTDSWTTCNNIYFSVLIIEHMLVRI